VSINYTFSDLQRLIGFAHTDAERAAIRRQLVENARAHPAELGPLLSRTDTDAAMAPTEFHRSWLDLALQYDRLLLLAPRGHAKSEWLSGIYPLWCIGHNPGIRILLLTTDDDQAVLHTRRIRQQLESPTYRAIFPGVPKLSKSTETQLKLDIPGAHPTWRAAGINSIAPGGRADLIILDDVVGRRNSRTPALREELRCTYDAIVRGMLTPRTGRIVVVGTPYYQGDIYDHLSGLRGVDERPIYATHRYSALTRDGLPQCAVDFSEGATPLWPERFSLPSLQQARMEMGEIDFGSQLLCTLLAAQGDVFDRSWFDLVAEAPQIVECWVVADTAISEDAGADHTVIVTAGRDATGAIYILDLQRGQWAPTESQSRLKLAAGAARTAYKGAFRGIAIEDTKEARMLVAWLQSQQVGRPVLIPHGGLSKYERAQCVVPRLEQGLCRFLRAQWNGATLDELCSFTRDGGRLGDDRVDAIVYACALLWQIRFTRDTSKAPGRVITLGRSI
jgi:predicted phage terminase large subunit-like protein